MRPDLMTRSRTGWVTTASAGVLASEGTAVGEMHGPFEHVAAPERAPQVADAVVTAGDGDSGGAQPGDGRDREVVHGGGDEADPGIGQLPAEPVLGGLVGLSQAVHVADRDASAESGRLGPFDDQLELP